MEVEEGRNGGGLGGVTLALRLGDSIQRCVEAGNVRLMVLLVMQLHNLARDIWLESPVVICVTSLPHQQPFQTKNEVPSHTPVLPNLRELEAQRYLHERSGRVALPRTKLVPASAATGLIAPEARRAPRRAGAVRIRADDIAISMKLN
jgi:hypothetical protein